jgi:tetratricopeptide (TPR) repeat protein
MSLRIRLWFVLLLGAALSGCVPSDQDEEKEPHYVLGLSRINAMDYQGAVEAFEESLDVNPHSAAAHYQLAMLYENQESDPAAAIYHYEQYLKYDPTAENADIIRQRIGSCKQQLAQDVMGMSSSPQAQQQLETVVEQNRQLQQQVNTLQASLKQWGDWYTTYSNQLAAARDNAATPVTPQNNYVAQPSPTPVQPYSLPTQQSVVTQPVHPVTPHSDTPSATTGSRTHVVQHGETAMAICRQYGIKLTDLKNANPTINPSRLRTGEVLNIP